MRGWRHVGRLGDPVESVLADVPPDSIIALSPWPDGPLRCGTMRADLSAASHLWSWPISTAALGDHIFVATAIGEHAFDPAPRTPSE